MSQDNRNPLDPMELASLPADDPRRQAFEQQLAAMPPTDRARWTDEFSLTDLLRHILSDVPTPPDLRARLLAIAQNTPAPNANRRRFLGMSRGFAIAATLVLIAGLVAFYVIVGREPATPAYLNAAVSKKIAVLAVENRSAPLGIASSDAEAVKKSLESSGMDVPVLMLTPSEGSTLTGGGTCDFGGTKGAFTQWKNGTSTYTLYEFNGKKLGVPGNFYAAAERPTELWHDAFHYQVRIFPGQEGKCCWVLVMETEDAKNIFSKYTGGY